VDDDRGTGCEEGVDGGVAGAARVDGEDVPGAEVLTDAVEPGVLVAIGGGADEQPDLGAGQAPRLGRLGGDMTVLEVEVGDR
jgi:hypothetical protein